MRSVIGTYFVVTCLLLGVHCANYLKETQPWLDLCDISKPKGDDCLSKDMQNIIHEFQNGYPGFKGFKTLDPFLIKKLSIDESGTGGVNFKMILTDLKLTAFKNVVVSEAKYPTETEWRHKFFFPNLKMEGKYKMDGRILVVPIRGEGDFLLETENMEANVVSRVKLFDRDNHSFFNVTRVKVDYKIGGFKIKAENLFNGNKQLSDATNAFLNENWQDVSEAMKPTVLKSLEEIMREVSNALFGFVPADFLIKDVRNAHRKS